MLKRLAPLFLPTRAPLGPGHPPAERLAWWRTLCVVSVVPLTAGLHHAVFYRPMCLLMPFGGDYRDADAVGQLLTRDPAIPWAVVVALVVYRAGLASGAVQRLGAAFFVSALPVAVWIWDVPFTGRAVCRYLHDEQVVIGGESLRTRHLYLATAAVYAVLTVKVWARHRATPWAGEREGAPSVGPVAASGAGG